MKNGDITDLIGGSVIRGSCGYGSEISPYDRINMYTQNSRDAIKNGRPEIVLKYLEMIEEASAEADLLADKDSLTGIMKRATFERDFQKAQSIRDRSGVPFVIMIADVDNFKEINDKYGHVAGDVVLKEVVSRISKDIRNADGVYRCGGDEFSGIYSGVGAMDALVAVAKAVDGVYSKPIRMRNGEEVKVSISAGIYCVGKDDSFESAKERADDALYRSKEAGSNRASI